MGYDTRRKPSLTPIPAYSTFDLKRFIVYFEFHSRVSHACHARGAAGRLPAPKHLRDRSTPIAFTLRWVYCERSSTGSTGASSGTLQKSWPSPRRGCHSIRPGVGKRLYRLAPPRSEPSCLCLLPARGDQYHSACAVAARSPTRRDVARPFCRDDCTGRRSIHAPGAAHLTQVPD